MLRMFLRLRQPAICIMGLLLPASAALAVPTPITSADSPQCDALSLPAVVEELGVAPPFPANSAISVVRLADTSTSACAAVDSGALANIVLEITNLTGIDFAEVWYTGDSGPSSSTVSNFDGLVNGGSHAFRIDATGSNTPLLSESISADGVFENGESWVFILQDFQNILSLPPESLRSVGLDSGTKNSTGSILAIVPEPSTAALLLLGLGGLGAVARRRG